MTTNIFPKQKHPEPGLWKISPTVIVTLPENGIFVFESRLNGEHLSGAALKAHQSFGAQMRVGRGRTGDCYALPVKRTRNVYLHPFEVEHEVMWFLEYVTSHPELDFYISSMGTKLRGLTTEAMANMFYIVAVFPEYYQNLHVPKSFVEHFTEIRRFDESCNSHLEEIIKAQPIMDILDNEKYYIALMNKLAMYGDSGLLPEEQQWINEFRQTEEYKRIAEELASEAGE